MHLVTFNQAEHTRIGIWDRDRAEIIDLSRCAPELPRDMLGLITQGASALSIAKQCLSSGEARLPLAQVSLLAPLPQPPRNVFCVGKNFPDHVKEVQSVVASSADVHGNAPTAPILFTKLPTAIIGSGQPIPAFLDYTESVDYEGELAVVIGVGGRGITSSQAFDHVFGYTIVNDVTSRRMQKLHQQWFMGKSLDGFCPMGPCIVTREAVPDVGALRIQTRVNDELRQDGIIRDMIFNIPSLIEILSRTMTLQPGDIIATGTPAGVGMGFNPPKYLRSGDQVAVTIEPIGTLTNPVA